MKSFQITNIVVWTILLSKSTNIIVRSESMLCVKRKNITVIPHIDIYQEWHGRDDWIIPKVKNQGMQLRYFVKALLESSCFEVWFYSPIQNSCIRQTEENYVQFLETEWMAMTSTDDNNILNLLSNIPNSNDDMEQTLLFFSYYLYPKEEITNKSTIADKLKDKQDKYNIILICHKDNSVLCTRSENWLARQKVIHTSFSTQTFNPHLHSLLLNLIKNPSYDWYERYARNQNHCHQQISNKTNIFIWPILLLNKTDARKDFLKTAFSTGILENHFSYFTPFYHALVIVDWQNRPYWGPYNLKSKDTERILWEHDGRSTSEVNKAIGELTGEKIHIISYSEDIIPNFDAPPFTFDNTIIIVVDDKITESPMINKDGNFVLWEEDIMSPLFIRMLIQKMNSIICGK